MLRPTKIWMTHNIIKFSVKTATEELYHTCTKIMPVNTLHFQINFAKMLFLTPPSTRTDLSRNQMNVWEKLSPWPLTYASIIHLNFFKDISETWLWHWTMFAYTVARNCYIEKNKKKTKIINYKPVGTEIYFPFKCSNVVDVFNSLQPQLFNFWSTQKVCYVNNIKTMIINKQWH